MTDWDDICHETVMQNGLLLKINEICRKKTIKKTTKYNSYVI